ncbi:MAG: glycosyltransferase [Devosia sp.]|nr:glycosyltransferase [Devosia sp.]
MRFIFYTHSLVSDWNHGNAHFLRGVMRDLVRRGHSVLALEPADSWSRQNLIENEGIAAIKRFATDFPELHSQSYGKDFDHAAAVSDADVVVVHEWTDPKLVEQLGRIRQRAAPFTLLFHDTHHRAVSAKQDIASLMLRDYDGILAFGETLRQRYLDAGWGKLVFTWHEAADDILFRPMPEIIRDRELIWIGNWGDDERTAEIDEFLIRPAEALGLEGTVRGVRYPEQAIAAVRRAGLKYGGWIANADAPAAFARHRVTLHIPRRPYVQSLPGIPTIRVFEALAGGIPLLSAPWEDAEGLFRPGKDFLFAKTGKQMQGLLQDVIAEPAVGRELAANGLETIRARHTCRHRVDELFAILIQVGSAQVTKQLNALEVVP